MSLTKKSLLFLSAVLTMQLLVFVGLGLSARNAQQEAERVAYSNRVVSVVSGTGQSFTQMSYCLVLYAATGNKRFKERFEQSREELPKMLAQLENEQFASPQDNQDIREAMQHLRFITEEMSSLEPLIGTHASPLEFLRVQRVLTLQVQPHVSDLLDSLLRVENRHRYVQKSFSAEPRVRSMLSQFLVSGFVLDVLATVVIVVGFSRAIVRRLSIIAQNFDRFARGQALNAQLPGGDEIALLDHQFHSLSTALKEASAKDEAVFRNMPVGLITCTDDGRIESLNPRARSLLLLQDGSLSRERMSDCFSDRREFDHVMELASQESGEGARVHLLRSDGQAVSVEVTTSVFKLAGQTRYLFAFIDVSAREEVERLRQEFVTIVSHDLRAPLTSIKACLSLFSEERFGAVNERGRELLSTAQKESDRLVALATDLLEMAKLQAGTLSLNLEVTDVDLIMERAVDAAAMRAASAQIKLHYVPSFTEVLADPDRVIQILINFIDNAIKFSPAGSEIRLEAERDGDWVRISSIDQGRGISPADQEHVFDRFRQVHELDAELGSGLGLAICKLLAESHGGSVGVSSEEGSGSKFWVRLPAAGIKTSSEGAEVSSSAD